MAVRTEAPVRTDQIRPFTVEIPEAELDALRRRSASTRWPDGETVGDQSQGVPG
ncbi:epoxide hydrolase N-terminal domain-containing protein [Micromonospora radicis]|uniref:epoxide hydrolase N-terminal domain-containing protein n=1 Tax=Micromonospora radicis TaxID=1894971 RepID=UPI0013141BF7|nr:epoxide hydrolase N-terminal domain-containing protein [Micromonospora radicis]